MIRIISLSYIYADGHQALRSIDLDIPDGQLLLIAGANGSGKTTLLRHLNGLLKPQTGDVMIDDISVAADIRAVRRKVGMIFQESDSQIIGETVFADVAFGPENLSWPRETIRAAVNGTLVKVGLDHLADQSPYLLSGGERKRLTIAGVLVMKPQIIVFDEPFANLDYPGVRSVLEQITVLHQQGNTIIISAHDVEKIVYYAQRLVVMKGGRIVADGVPEEVLPDLERFDIRMPCRTRLGMPVDSWLN